MPKQWNGVLATQTVPFRGTSTVSVLNTTTASPNFRTISDAAYAVNVAGGISGSFGVHVIGTVGGVTFVVAGVTAIGAVGNFVLYPVGYSSTGAAGAVGAVSVGVNAIHRLDHLLPPLTVAFQSGVATAGISANCTVSGTLHQEN